MISFLAMFTFTGMILLPVLGFLAVAGLISLASSTRHNGWFWKVVVGATILIGAFLLKLKTYRESHQANAARQMAVAQAQFDEQTARFAEMNGIDSTSARQIEPFPISVVNHGATVTTYADRWSLILLVLIPLAAFAAVRRYRSDVGASAGRGFAGAAVAALALVVLGAFWFTARVSYVPPPQVAYVEPADQFHGAIPLPAEAPDLPLDELWVRLNDHKIQITKTSTSNDGEPASAGGRPAEQPATAVTTSPTNPEPIDQVAELDSPASPIQVATQPKKSPESRPDWVKNPPKFYGARRRMVLQAGPYSMLNECYEALRTEMHDAVLQHLQDLVHESSPSAYVPDLDQLGVGNSYITRELLVDQYVEETEASFGLTQTAWGLLEFTETHDQHLLDAWKNYARRDRITGAIVLAGAVLSVIGGALALLKFDTWTRGYYTKRLLIGVPAAIIAMAALLLGFTG